jgi:hypothetical protein
MTRWVDSRAKRGNGWVIANDLGPTNRDTIIAFLTGPTYLPTAIVTRSLSS